MQTVLKKMENLLKLRNYSSKTRKSYLFYVAEYLEFSKEKKIKNRNEAIEKF